MKVEDRFWLHVDKNGPIPPDFPELGRCWTWTMGVDRKGYGVFHPHGDNMQAHRYSYELANGSIPDGAVIDHKCYNPPCVRPSHLHAVSSKQNNENRHGANRNNHSSGIRGVTWHKGASKWAASIMHQRKNVYLGLYIDIHEAENACIEARQKIFSNSRLDEARP